MSDDLKNESRELVAPSPFPYRPICVYSLFLKIYFIAIIKTYMWKKPNYAFFTNFFDITE